MIERCFLLIGHKDSVSCSGFSHDGKYVCTSDLSGVIQVRQVIGEEGKLIWQFETSSIEVRVHVCYHCRVTAI